MDKGILYKINIQICKFHDEEKETCEDKEDAFTEVDDGRESDY
jgi:hypothetical protein